VGHTGIESVANEVSRNGGSHSLGSVVLHSGVDVQLDSKALRFAALAVVVGGALRSHIPGEPGIACPLRAITGVPCPGCGMTTGVTQLLAGDPMGALRANPYSIPFVLLCIAAVATFIPWVRQRLSLNGFPASRIVLKVPFAVVVAVLTSSWAFQLVRVF